MSCSIALEGVGKRYQNEWIFRHLSQHFTNQQSYAILGPNGSGKSTLVQILGGSLLPTLGAVGYTVDEQPVEGIQIFKHLAWAAPYLELIEELTLSEVLSFHFQFKSPLAGLTADDIRVLIDLPNKATHQSIRYFSSGMKQRLKVALAVLSNVPIVLLDEPTMHLDANGVRWYQQLMEQFGKDRLVIVASNQPHEYEFCEVQIQIGDYK